MKEKMLKRLERGLLVSLSLLLILAFTACGSATPAQTKEALPETTAAETAEAKTTEEEVETTEQETEPDQETEPAENPAPVDIINLDGLKEIEEKDSFEVKVTKKEIIKSAFSGYSTDGNDACAITITNNTNVDITEVTILTVAYGQDNGLRKLQSGLIALAPVTVGSSSASEKYVQVFTTKEDVTIGAKNSETVNIRCKADGIAGVRIIVDSYKTADGVEHENSAAEEWYKNVMMGQSTVLD